MFGIAPLKFDSVSVRGHFIVLIGAPCPRKPLLVPNIKKSIQILMGIKQESFPNPHQNHFSPAPLPLAAS